VFNAREQFLMRLETQRERVGGQLNSLNRPDFSMGGSDDIGRQLHDGFPMIAIYAERGLIDDRPQSGFASQPDRVKIAWAIVLDCSGYRPPKVGRQPAAVQTRDHLHPGAEPKYRLAGVEKGADQAALDVKAFRRGRSGWGPHIPFPRISESPASGHECIEFDPNHRRNVLDEWYRERQASRIVNAPEVAF